MIQRADALADLRWEPHGVGAIISTGGKREGEKKKGGKGREVRNVNARQKIDLQ
jgi:hypothetical protein